jgi:hypothetical protein
MAGLSGRHKRGRDIAPWQKGKTVTLEVCAWLDSEDQAIHLASDESETFTLNSQRSLAFVLAIGGDAPLTTISIRDSVFFSRSRK